MYHIKKSHIISALVVVAATGAIIAGQHNVSRVGPAELYPTNTPGVTNPAVNQSNIQQTICVSGYTATIRPPANYTTVLKQEQLAASAASDPSLDLNPASYEEDHLISLELGGNPTDSKNLWPEAYHTQVNGVEVGAHQKDQTENTLHRLVCSNQLTLKEAQDTITGDWYKFYRDNLQNKTGQNFGSIEEYSTSDD